MRVNWMVPVRGLAHLSLRLAKMIWVPIEIAIGVVLVPPLYLAVLIATGFEVTCRKIRRIMKVADYALTDAMFDGFGHVWANVEGKAGLEHSLVNDYTSIRLVNEGFVVEILDDKNRYLAPYVEHDHSIKPLAKIFADVFLTQDLSKIQPTEYKL